MTPERHQELIDAADRRLAKIEAELEKQRQNYPEHQFAEIGAHVLSPAEKEYLRRLSEAQRKSNETVFPPNVRF